VATVVVAMVEFVAGAAIAEVVGFAMVVAVVDFDLLLLFSFYLSISKTMLLLQEHNHILLSIPVGHYSKNYLGCEDTKYHQILYKKG